MEQVIRTSLRYRTHKMRLVIILELLVQRHCKYALLILYIFVH